MRKLVLVLLVFVSACAPKIVPAPVVTNPRFPEFMQPQLPADVASSPAGTHVSRGWAFLQSGDTKTAEHEFTSALSAAPALTQAEASLGYVELAKKDPKAALGHFDRAVAKAPDAVAAQVGRGQALIALNREADALSAFEAAVALDPSLTEIRRRIEVLRFRGLEQHIARARQLARQGNAEEAAKAYASAIASSPDSPFLYRELAAIERQRGNSDAALADYRKAAELDPTDPRSREQIGEILEARDDLDGAAAAYGEALAIESNPDVEARLERVRGKMALARLPAEYRAIDESQQLTRGELAALIGVRLAPLLAADGGTDALITDVRNHWAADWIMSVTRAGIMEPYANHAFQPRAIVRRSDFAQVVARLLARIAAQHPGRQNAWESARLKFSDLPPTHLAYAAASAAVASGVMKAGADNAFQPARPLSGAEAIAAIERLEALAGLPGPFQNRIRR
jgi:tetratricopeptide (TPR) repeat protein